jgi:predicted RNA methylase
MNKNYAEIAKRNAEKRRLSLEGLQDTKHHHRQAAFDAWKKNNGRESTFQEVEERIEENKIVTGHNFDLFPTPDHLADRMADLAGVCAGMKVLEPEAGTGRIAKAVRRRGVEPVCIEFGYTAYEFLKKQNFNVTQDDFLAVDPASMEKFNVVLMNPPFSNMADIDHVLHAYKFLADGGVLAAIVSEGSFNGDRKKVVMFREWLSANRADVNKLPERTFEESGTNVNSRLILVRK